MYDYTHDIVSQLVEQGTVPFAVQVGNEISNGFLWEEDGAGCETGGRLWCSDDEDDDWARFGDLVSAGIEAVRDASPESEVAIHTDLGNSISKSGIDWLVKWHNELIANLNDGVLSLIHI